jgi:transcriptional regulator with XRE-family HTH domain
MGSKKRRRPQRLAEKLKEIRKKLGLSQREMVRRLGIEDLTREEISAFERGTHEPNLIVLLAYARIARMHLEVLADDSLDLPRRLPSSARH